MTALAACFAPHPGINANDLIQLSRDTSNAYHTILQACIPHVNSSPTRPTRTSTLAPTADPALLLNSTHWTSPSNPLRPQQTLPDPILFSIISHHPIGVHTAPHSCPDPRARLPHRTIISPMLIGPLSTSGRTSGSKTGQLACEERASRRHSIDHIRVWSKKKVKNNPGGHPSRTWERSHLDSA